MRDVQASQLTPALLRAGPPALMRIITAGEGVSWLVLVALGVLVDGWLVFVGLAVEVDVLVNGWLVLVGLAVEVGVGVDPELVLNGRL